MNNYNYNVYNISFEIAEIIVNTDHEVQSIFCWFIAQILRCGTMSLLSQPNQIAGFS